MGKYIAYVKQYGGGCDYTIGCGQTLWELEASSLEDARIEVKNEVLVYTGLDRIDSATIYEVTHCEIMSVHEWYADEERRKKDEELQAKEVAEREEFERLQQKFGKG